MRGSQMIVLHPFLGNRLRNHIVGPDFVIAEVALTPPLVLISFHAPSSSASQEQYEQSFSGLLDELSHLLSKSPPGTRLVLGSDLNTQLVPNPPTIGTWTNPSERSPDLLRANTAFGAMETLSMTVISSFFDLGPTRIAWPSAKKRGATDSTIDYVAVTSSLKGRVSVPSHFPTITTSDHIPLYLEVLAPKRDKRYRQHLIEHLLPSSDRVRLPTSWQPTNRTVLQERLAQDIPATLSELTTHIHQAAKAHTLWGQEHQSKRKFCFRD